LSEEQIRKRTAELHLTRWSAPWTQEEVDFVLERAREFAVADIARELGRTPKGVYVKLWKIRISARFQDGYTQGELVQALHISRRKLRRWIRLGWLTLYERRIKDRALVRFLEGHSEEIDVARFDKDFRLWLRSLGLQESESHPRRLPKTVLQSLKEHSCGRCGRKVKGNAIHVHIRACKRRSCSTQGPGHPNLSCRRRSRGGAASVKGHVAVLLPAEVRTCPGFLAAEAVARGANPTEETYFRFNRFVEWIEDHKFAKPMKEG